MVRNEGFALLSQRPIGSDAEGIEASFLSVTINGLIVITFPYVIA